MQKTSGGGGEWTALREAVEAVAKDAVQIAIMRSDLTWDADTEQTEESIAEDAAQALFGEGTCSDEPTANVKKLLALAAAAPAPHHRWPTTRNKAETGAPPPQDGQGAELLGPPRGGSSSDLADHRNEVLEQAAKLIEAAKCLPACSAVMHDDSCPYAFPEAAIRGMKRFDEPSKAEREVATATVSQGRVICPKCGSSDSTLPHTTGNGIAYNCSRCWLVFTPPSLPEAVAGNASAPVGEKRRKVDELLSRIAHKPDISRAPGVEQYGGDAMKALRNMWSDCPCVSDCTACQLKSAIDAERAAGQPSGVGEPREKPTNLQAEPPYPNHETVVMAMRAPNWMIHVLTDRCQKDWPHEMKDCAEWAIGPEVGEGLREALEKHEYRNGACLCEKFIMPSYGHSDLVKLHEIHPTADIRWRYWLDHVTAALAAPAPKPAPPAEPLETTMGVNLSVARYNELIKAEQKKGFLVEALERVYALPGVRKLALDAAALAAPAPKPAPPAEPLQLTIAEKHEVASILLNMVYYKHGPASAREWVEGVINAIGAWRQAKLDDPNFYDANAKSLNNVRRAAERKPPR